MTRAELKARAKAQLGNSIFSNNWMLALVVCLISTAISGILAATAVLSIVAFIIAGPINFAVAYIFLKQARDGKPADLTDMIKGFTTDAGQNILIGVMISIFTFLWSLLFVIPGIVKAISYSMAYYIKADHPEYDWRQCIDESKRIMNGHKAEYFVLVLSFIGWAFVGAITIVGGFWVAPYISATSAQFYESIKAQ